MDQILEEPGRIVRRDGQVRAVLTRVFDHPGDAVWAALTEPERLAQWLAAGRIELREGGSAKLDFADSGIVIDSRVSAFDPGRLIEYAWSGPGEPLRPLRWELAPAGDACRLTLSVAVPEGEDAARAFAGWEAHLDMLAAALEGVPIKFPFERFKAARAAYAERLAA